MTTLDTLLQRKSVRAFLDKPVSQELIIKILDAAAHAPSGKNTQPWQVAVVSGNTKTVLDKKLEDAFWQNIPKELDYQYYSGHLTPEFKHRAVVCGTLLYKTLGIEKTDKEKRLKQWALNYSSFGAPVTLYFFANPCVEKGSFIDYGMFLQSIMLMATSLGLATCPQASLAEYPTIIKNELGYGHEQILICGMALGYEDTHAIVNSYRTPREAVNNFTQFFN